MLLFITLFILVSLIGAIFLTLATPTKNTKDTLLVFAISLPCLFYLAGMICIGVIGIVFDTRDSVSEWLRVFIGHPRSIFLR